MFRFFRLLSILVFLGVMAAGYTHRNGVSALSLAPGSLPNAALTPGAVVRAGVTTICRTGYSRSVRPTGETWYQLKRAAFLRYGYPRLISGLVGDHLVPIEIGGAPTDLRNIWPEALNDALKKDVVEDAARIAVCFHGYPLQQMQVRIAHDWRTAIPSNFPFTENERSYLQRVSQRTGYGSD
jgi:hypothetical protein